MPNFRWMAPANSFDVVLTADVGDPAGPFDIEGFSVRLTLAPASGVTFTRATTGTAAPYLFAPAATLGLDSAVSGGGTVIDFSDFGASRADVRPVAAGYTFRLGRVYFEVSASAPDSPPTVAVVVDTAGDVVDGDGISLAPALSDGGIRVDAVPEPPASTLVALGVLLAGSAAARRRRGAN